MNKQRIEEILNNAPEGATHYGHYEDNSVCYLMCGDSGYYSLHKGKWSRLSGIGGTFIHNLSGLQTQLDQINEIERLKSAIVNSRWTRTDGEDKHYCNFCQRNLTYSEHDDDCVIKELNK